MFLAGMAGAITLAVVIALVLAVTNSDSSARSTRTSTSVSVESPAPVAEAQLDGLLLDAAAINSAMQTTGITVSSTVDQMAKSEWPTNSPDKDCAFISHMVDATVAYSGTSWTGVRGQVLKKTLGNGATQTVVQSVVALRSVTDASAFYAASASSWPACSNRRYTDSAQEPPVVVVSRDDVRPERRSVDAATAVNNPNRTLQRASIVRITSSLTLEHARAVQPLSARGRYRRTDRRESARVDRRPPAPVKCCGGHRCTHRYLRRREPNETPSSTPLGGRGSPTADAVWVRRAGRLQAASGLYLRRCRAYGHCPVVEHFTTPRLVERHGDGCYHCRTGAFRGVDHLRCQAAVGGPHRLANTVPCCRSRNSGERWDADEHQHQGPPSARQGDVHEWRFP